jgi:hypothetical protein
MGFGSEAAELLSEKLWVRWKRLHVSIDAVMQE